MLEISIPPSPCNARADCTPHSELAETTPAGSETDGHAPSELSWCSTESTCSPEDFRDARGCDFDLESPKVLFKEPLHTTAVSSRPPCVEKAVRSAAAPRLVPSQVAGNRYSISRDLLGGGRAGIVQKGVHGETGQEVAIKRLQRDARCPVRFLEVNLPGGKAFHAEGYAAVGAVPIPWSGSLVYHSTNEFAADPFQPGSLEGCIVLARRGGGATFVDKVFNAQRGNAVGVLIINKAELSEAYSIAVTGKPSIPSIMIGSADGEELLSLLASSEAKQEAVSAEVRTDAEHEVALCSQLPPHPNIIQVLDAWHEGDSIVVVSELCTGGKLAAPFAASPGVAVGRAVASSLWLVKQILAGVAHLHDQGVCHRDIKAENMLLTRRLDDPGARLVLIDFSMASVTDRMCVPCGSARYCAPEVFSGKYGRERDIWSVGVVAYELFFGKHPFAGGSDGEVLEHVSSQDACCVPDRGPAVGAVSAEIQDLLLRLLEKDPAKRATAAEALVHPALQDTQLPI